MVSLVDVGDHGTITRYTHRRNPCPCDKCRAAMASWQRQARRRRATRTVPWHVHGTENGYTNYLCRCDLCVEAKSIARAALSLRRRGIL